VDIGCGKLALKSANECKSMSPGSASPSFQLTILMAEYKAG
jgi:hypothetical protein